MLKVIALLFVCFIVFNLFVGLFHLVRGGEKSSGLVLRSLTIRLAGSIVLFAIILLTVYFNQS